MNQGWLSPQRFNLQQLRHEWSRSAPFPHLIVDDLLSSEQQEALFSACDDEPCELLRDEIFTFLVSAKSPRTEAIQRFRASLSTPEMLTALQEITGITLSRVELRAYAYEPGHYLLPHSDHQVEQGRKLALAYYLATPWPIIGGELTMFSCKYDGDELIETTPTKTIEPRPNRLVLFHVGDASLHQVREVTSGTRLSISGWFF